MYRCVHIHTHRHVHIHILHLHIRIHMHIHIHIHVHIHIHAQKSVRALLIFDLMHAKACVCGHQKLQRVRIF